MPEMTKKQLPDYVKAYDPWSAVFFVDPIVVPLTPKIARLGVTPNAVTILSFLCALFSGLMFAFCHWWYASGLFLATFFLDALDGKLARFTGTISEFGAKLDNFADFVRKPLCFLGIFVCSFLNERFFFAGLVVVAFVAHVAVHKLFIFLDINHCDLEFPKFHRKVVRRFVPRMVALYTYFDEQFILFIICPTIISALGLRKRGEWFFWCSIVTTGLCLLKLAVVCWHRRKGRYNEVHQDWFRTKGNLDKI